jgi:hypothetical protein
MCYFFSCFLGDRRCAWLLASLLLISMACKKSESINCNDSIVILATATLSDPCVSQGQITVQAPLGSNVEYRLNNGPYQSQPGFVALRAGQYRLGIKDAAGCVADTAITVQSLPPGPFFTAVKALFAANCLGCHSGNNPQAGIDLSNGCDIVQHWQRIKARAVDGNPSPMPQGGLLPLADRNKIVAWINAGHRFTD